MGGFSAGDIKHILYILPLLSGLICFIYVRALRKQAAQASDNSPGWRSMDLFGGTGGTGGAGGGPLAGGHTISMGGGLGALRDQELMPLDKHVGLVIEYNDAGLEAHAKKAKISGSVASMKARIAEVLTSNGLSAASSGPPPPAMPASPAPGGGSGGAAAASAAPPKDRVKSRLMFTGSVDRMKRAIWQLRESMSWLRSIPGVDDVATAYTVQQVGRGLKFKIKFEPCPILFNQE